MSFTYFSILLSEVPDFSDPDGLLDHGLVRRIFWFTSFSAFHPGFGKHVFQTAYALGVLGSCGIIAGYRVKACAGSLLIIAASACRWYFPVIFVDDSIMHLLLFWLLLLPVGKTLTAREILRDRREAFSRWIKVTVPGGAVAAFVGNIILLYLVAGVSKFFSPLWREGFALYAILRLPIAWFPDLLGPAHLEWTKIFSYSALLVEPLIPVLLLLRVGHPLKWFGLVCVVGFHLGIILTLKIPLANLACIGALVLSFRNELMAALVRCREALPPLVRATRIGMPGRMGLLVVALLAVAMSGGVPFIGAIHQPAHAVLWCLGLSQDYHLFNWIDRTNWTMKNHLTASDGARTDLDPNLMFPNSVRGALLQAYLHNVAWMRISPHDRRELALSMLPRLAQRFCESRTTAASIVLESDIQRIAPANTALERPRTRFLMEFECRDGQAVVCRTFMSNGQGTGCAAVE